MRTTSRPLLAAGFTAILASTAHAQTAPPIKPGLWEIQVERDGSAQKMPDMSEHLKNMPPEQRKQIEAMMKERGVDMSGGDGKIRMCMDKGSLDQGRWQGDQDGHCKTDVTHRGSTSWKWHSVCSEPKTETEGEATFTNPESYVVKTSTTMTVRGETKTVQRTIKSNWVGSDCGDVKPISSMKRPLAPKEK